VYVRNEVRKRQQAQLAGQPLVCRRRCVGQRWAEYRRLRDAGRRGRDGSGCRARIGCTVERNRRQNGGACTSHQAVDLTVLFIALVTITYLSSYLSTPHPREQTTTLPFPSPPACPTPRIPPSRPGTDLPSLPTPASATKGR